MMRLSKRTWSSLSMIWKFCGSLASAQCIRSSLCARLWKVPTHIERVETLSKLSVRARNSAAALLVNVTARTLWGEMFSTSINHAMRCTKTRVFPLPAPATTRALPRGAETAARCGSLSPSIMWVISNRHDPVSHDSHAVAYRNAAIRCAASLTFSPQVILASACPITGQLFAGSGFAAQPL